MPDLSDIRYQVALANRMLANEGVLDAFGHVSLRHPADPDRYLLSRSRSPGAGCAAVGAALCGACHPWLHLSGAA